jgi:hypothetical protein
MPRGRPTLYREEYPARAYKICLLGATDAELANFFGIRESTLNLWKHAHPDFMESITRGKLIADANVAERMYQRALGYSHEAVKIFMPAGASAPVYAPYVERYPPDTQAASLWLRNRQPGKWRDRVEHDHTVRREVRELSDEELLAIIGGNGAAGEPASPAEPGTVH